VELGFARKLDHYPGGGPDRHDSHSPHGAVVDYLGAGHARRVGIRHVDDDAWRRCEPQRGEAQRPVADELDDRGFRVARRPDREEPSRAGCQPCRQRERDERKHADLHLRTVARRERSR
jgi:hypothetical protein